MKLHWKDLTSHQKNSEVNLAPNLTLAEIKKLIDAVEDPFNGSGKITWNMNEVGLLKFHAQKYGV